MKPKGFWPNQNLRCTLARSLPQIRAVNEISASRNFPSRKTHISSKGGWAFESKVIGVWALLMSFMSDWFLIYPEAPAPSPIKKLCGLGCRSSSGDPGHLGCRMMPEPSNLMSRYNKPQLCTYSSRSMILGDSRIEKPPGTHCETKRLMDAQWINVFNPTHLYCSFPFFSLATRHISDEQT